MGNLTGNETLHCSKSEFGCCPDWYSPAEGEANLGCPMFVLGESINQSVNQSINQSINYQSIRRMQLYDLRMLPGRSNSRPRRGR